VLVAVSKLNSCLAGDVKALEAMTELRHGGARYAVMQSARDGAETTCGTEGRSFRRSLSVTFSWYPSRCGLIYKQLLVHERSASVKMLVLVLNLIVCLRECHS
jgi:hypothetical protein